ncbi:hypothetical protein [Leisingera sp. ANG-Vp]|uniref:hypothetical protein n=1 Tax=Leisingera sp. ANG-Vp TaxID=1577896 RepID=UPI00057F41D0|nr:hypothetical protein [Leisingera sp. ANG-Vp]KIC15013.1 hypothetical protein RA20_19150 [Leisingera sp. ANG-Vp]
MHFGGRFHAGRFAGSRLAANGRLDGWAGASFSPAEFFAGGVQGAWLEASDLATLFQDWVGTSPAVSIGDPVRLVLDKSQGLARAAELWNDEASYLTGSGFIDNGNGGYTHTGTSSGSVRVAGVFNEGGWIEVSAVISGGSFAVRVGDSGGSFNYHTASASGTFFLKVESLSSDNDLRFVTSDDGATISNIRARVIAGNHLTAPSDAARPTIKANGRLTDDAGDEALILPVAGIHSAYIAAGALLIADENVAMAADYDVLRGDLIGVVVLPAPLSIAKKQQLADYWGVSL